MTAHDGVTMLTEDTDDICAIGYVAVVGNHLVTLL